MIIGAGVLLGVLVAASCFLVVRGAAAAFRKSWRLAAAGLGGLALFALAVVLLAGSAAVVSGAFGRGDVDPSQKARLLAQAISELMNYSAFGVPIGIALGLVRAYRDRRRTA